MQRSNQKTQILDKLTKEDYQPASYKKALLYKNERSYLKKTDNTYVDIG